jgi:hypothetical protein
MERRTQAAAAAAAAGGGGARGPPARGRRGGRPGGGSGGEEEQEEEGDSTGLLAAFQGAVDSSAAEREGPEAGAEQLAALLAAEGARQPRQQGEHAAAAAPAPHQVGTAAGAEALPAPPPPQAGADEGWWVPALGARGRSASGGGGPRTAAGAGGAEGWGRASGGGEEPGRERTLAHTLWFMLVDVAAVARGPERRALRLAAGLAFFDQVGPLAGRRGERTAHGGHGPRCWGHPRVPARPDSATTPRRPAAHCHLTLRPRLHHRPPGLCLHRHHQLLPYPAGNQAGRLPIRRRPPARPRRRRQVPRRRHCAALRRPLGPAPAAHRRRRSNGCGAGGCGRRRGRRVGRRVHCSRVPVHIRVQRVVGGAVLGLRQRDLHNGGRWLSGGFWWRGV